MTLNAVLLCDCFQLSDHLSGTAIVLRGARLPPKGATTRLRPTDNNEKPAAGEAFADTIGRTEGGFSRGAAASSLLQQSPSIEAKSQIEPASDLAVTFGLYVDTYYDQHNSKT
jgi:hypothetical protein